MSEGTMETGGPRRNGDLADLHRRLVAMAAGLDEAVDAAPDATSVRKLTAQIVEVNSRVTAVGRQLFAQETRDLTDAARAVADAIPRAERALRDLARLDEALASVTSVLHLVDRAVGIAKAAA